MPTFDVTLDISLLFLICCIAALFGFAFRAAQLTRKNRRINELEREVMKSHEEILETQKEYCEMESRFRNLAIPVITMKHPAMEEEQKSEVRPDAGALRKNRPTRTGTA